MDPSSSWTSTNELYLKHIFWKNDHLDLLLGC